MPRPTFDESAHPRWPDGAPMGLGGQFRSIGMPGPAAELLLGVARMVEAVTPASGRTRERRNGWFRAANTEATNTQWGSHRNGAVSLMTMRNIIRRQILTPMGLSTQNRILPSTRRESNEQNRQSEILNEAQDVGSREPAAALSTGALSARLPQSNASTSTNVDLSRSPARSDSGRIRNVAAMTDSNLITLATQMRNHRYDIQAIARINAQLDNRGETTRRYRLTPENAVMAPPPASAPAAPSRVPVARRFSSGDHVWVTPASDEGGGRWPADVFSDDGGSQVHVREIITEGSNRGQARPGNSRPVNRNVVSARWWNNHQAANGGAEAVSTETLELSDERGHVLQQGDIVTRSGSSNQTYRIVNTDRDNGGYIPIENSQGLINRVAPRNLRFRSTNGTLSNPEAPARAPVLDRDGDPVHDGENVPIHRGDRVHVGAYDEGVVTSEEVGPGGNVEVRVDGRVGRDTYTPNYLEVISAETTSTSTPIVDQPGRNGTTRDGHALRAGDLVHVEGSARAPEGYYTVHSAQVDSDGEIPLTNSEGSLAWAAPRHIASIHDGETPATPTVTEPERHQVTDHNGNRVTDRAGITIRRGDRVWSGSDAGVVTSFNTDGSGRVTVHLDDSVPGAGDAHLPPDILTVVPDGETPSAAATPAEPFERPHQSPRSSQQLAENIVAAFSHDSSLAASLPNGASLAVRTPASGATSRIVLVRPNRRDETYAHVRHRDPGVYTGAAHQISFVHGSDQILGSALRPGGFRQRPRGAAHRQMSSRQAPEAAQVLANAIRGGTRRTVPDRAPAGADRASRTTGEVPLPGMMARTHRRPGGYGGTPSGDMLPVRDGEDRAFGIEIEMTGISFGTARAAIGRVGLPVDEREAYSTKNWAAWCACQDGSLGYGDPEVKFPPLSGQRGMDLMRRGVEALRGAGGRAGRQSTHGLHVHIDSRDMMQRDKRLELAQTYSNNRDLINKIVAPARNRGAGSYAREGYSGGHGGNELALNFGGPTIEFRRLGSNLVADDIEGWSILMRSIVNYTKTHDGALPPQADLLTLMRALGVPLDAQSKIMARVARITPSVTEE